MSIDHEYVNKRYVEVEWEDTIENQTRENERKLKYFFRKKYNTNSVKIIPKTISADDGETELRADASKDIHNVEYQRQLMRSYIDKYGYNVDFKKLERLDDLVNEDLKNDKGEVGKANEIDLKEIKLFNFLSFADKEHKLVFDDYQGITSVISDPPNYAGKTILVLDTLLFLFFNKTIRTERAKEIFNHYSDSNVLYVHGTFETGGEVYVIERQIDRHQITRGKNKGEYETKGNVNFYKWLNNGETHSLNKSTPQATDKEIEQYVGNYEDFMLTILTTSNNLEDLISTKPTERGHIFTRFIGLDILRHKEDYAKKRYSKWSAKTYLHTNQYDNIDEDIENKKSEQEENENLKEAKEKEERELKQKITDKKQESQQLQQQKFGEIDEDLLNSNLEKIQEGINDLNTKMDEKQKQIKEEREKMIKPNEDYSEEKYRQIQNEINNTNEIYYQQKNRKDETDQQVKDLEQSQICPTCKRPLDVDYSDKIKSLKGEVEELDKEVSELTMQLENKKKELYKLDEIRKKWNEYDKHRLNVQQYELDYERLKSNKEKGEEKLRRYHDNKSKIDKNKEIDQKIFNLTYELEDLENKKEEILLSKNNYENKINSIKEEIKELKEIKEKIKVEHEYDRVFKTYIELFSKKGITKMVLATQIPVINSYLSQLLSYTANFSLEVTLNKKNELDFYMHKEGDKVQPLRMGSGYEKTVSSLALRCVLAKICSLPKLNCMVFDEPFGTISDENLDRVEDFFIKLKDYFSNIYILTHNPLVKEWSDNKLLIKNINQKSYLYAA